MVGIACSVFPPGQHTLNRWPSATEAGKAGGFHSEANLPESAAALIGQPDIVLRQRRHRVLRRHQIIQLGAAACAARTRSFSGKWCISEVRCQEKRSAFQTRARALCRIGVDAGLQSARRRTRSARRTGSARRPPRGSAPWLRSAARYGRRRRRGTACRNASARRRRSASGAIDFSIEGPVDQRFRRFAGSSLPAQLRPRSDRPTSLRRVLVQRALDIIAAARLDERIEHSAKPRSSPA